jgi:hypothetical protein
MVLNTVTILNGPKYFEIVPNRDLSHTALNAGLLINPGNKKRMIMRINLL